MKLKLFVLMLIVLTCSGCAINRGLVIAPKNTWTQKDVDAYNESVKETIAGHHDAAVKLLIESANSGYPQAQYELGTMYVLTFGPEHDPKKGFYYLRQAAIQGNTDAQLELGSLYDSGTGVDQDYEQAFYWYKKAADKGNADAENAVGVMYEYGKWVSLDFTKAFDWYKKSAKQQNPKAIFNIAGMYLKGWGLYPDNDRAIATYQLAAHFGSLEADVFLGKAYRDGLYGLKRDHEMSDNYFKNVANLKMHNPRELEYAVHTIIDAHREYPPDAVKEKVTGTTVISFYYQKNTPFDISIAKSSGNDELDNAAFDAVKDSVFPLPPKALVSKIHFLIPVTYCLYSICTASQQAPSHRK